MKTLFLCATILYAVIISTPSNASPLKHWGFKAGYTSATLDWEHDFIPSEDLTRTSGLSVGVFTEWFDYRNLSLTVGMNYEQKGTGFHQDVRVFVPGPVVAKTSFSRTHYLSFPFLAKYKIGDARVSPYLLAGPRVDVFLGYSKDESAFVWGIEDEFADVVFGLSAGIGTQWRAFGSRTMLVEFVYNYDPFPLYEFTNQATGNEQSVRNNSFNISLGLGL
jgi:hypothetical protein